MTVPTLCNNLVLKLHILKRSVTEGGQGLMFPKIKVQQHQWEVYLTWDITSDFQIPCIPKGDCTVNSEIGILKTHLQKTF